MATLSFAIHDQQQGAYVAMTALSELLNQHLPDGWTASDVERAAHARGYVLTRQTAWGFLTGKRHASKPDEDTLNAFSDVLSIPIKKLRVAAGLPEGENEPWLPPAESSRLNRRQRVALEDFIRATVDAIDQSASEPQQVLRAASQPARMPNRRRSKPPEH